MFIKFPNIKNVWKTPNLFCNAGVTMVHDNKVECERDWEERRGSGKGEGEGKRKERKIKEKEEKRREIIWSL